MSLFSRLYNTFRQDKLNQDLDEELNFHAEQRAAGKGIALEEARRRLGNPLRLREQSRDIKVAVWLDSVLQDLSLAGRVWRRRPLVALTAIATIALGAGMNVAVFQVLWNVILRPLPYAESRQLVQIWFDFEQDERGAPWHTALTRWRENSHQFSGFAAYRPWRVTMDNGGYPEQLFGAMVSSDYFAVLGSQMLAGRAFTPDEVRPGTDNVVLLREGYWRRRLGARIVVGSDIQVDGTLRKVVGIVPDSLTSAPLIQSSRKGASSEPDRVEPEVYLPLSRAVVGGFRLQRSFAIGRLKAGASISQATQELQALTTKEEKGRVWLAPLDDEVGQALRPALFALIAGTLCVLLIACSNLANLLLAQAMLRRRELAVRAALGAGRARVVRQLITEAMLLSLMGGAGGLLAAQVILRGMISLYPGAIPRMAEGGSAWLVYLFAFGVTVLCGLLFGALPAWRATNGSTEDALRVSGAWMSRGTRRWAQTMVAVQVGLTAVVLLSAGLLMRTFFQLREINVGFVPEQVVTASVDLPETRYKSREDRARFGAAWLERLRAIPGVSAAGISNSLPMRYTALLNIQLRIPGFAGEQLVGGRGVAGDYFQAMGMQWVAGGPFQEGASGQYVVNEAFVRKYLKGGPAVGVPLPQGNNMITIVGVVKDVRHQGLRANATPEVFLPYRIFPLNPVDAVVRTTLPVSQIVPAMQAELRALDTQVALGRPTTMRAVVDDELGRERFLLVLLGLFGAVATGLAAVGTYGVIAQSVRARVPEMGLRRALGAGTWDLWRLVLGEGLRAPLLGLAFGLAAGWLLVGRLLASLLYGVTPRDPAVYAGAAALLAFTALLACALPSRHAAGVEPARALRQE
jgi:predicted permease